MPKPRVYIETTIPSFYHTTRTGMAALARREWTRRWWAEAADAYELVTSDAVHDELKAGDYPSQRAAIGLLHGIPLLEFTPAVGEIVEAYFRFRLGRQS